MDAGPRRFMTLLLTGAPCAGKSTIADMLERRLTGHHTRVIVVREVATALILAGGGRMEPIEFQRQILATQVRLENEACEAAEALSADGYDVLIVLDRGRRDGKIFCDASTWAAIGGDEVEEGQYDIIAHLTSLAVDAPATFDDAQRQGQNAAREYTRAQCATMCPQFRTLYTGAPVVTLTGSTRPVVYKLRRLLEVLRHRIPHSMMELQLRITAEIVRLPGNMDRVSVYQPGGPVLSHRQIVAMPLHSDEHVDDTGGGDDSGGSEGRPTDLDTCSPKGFIGRLSDASPRPRTYR
jgi:hypothetical protein